jgi:phosphatidylserine/phosphatidylglycerophosphate/cardiolipin synthase-like enzyme
VRLLIDDFSIQGRDIGLRTLDSHPRIDVRIFNPVIERNAALRWFSLLADINRISRRMHNKALMALAVIGGRNIGDEYFDLDHDMNFRDRDLLVAGPAVSELATGFSGYWNHPLSIPVTKLVTSPPEPELFEDLPPADHPPPITPTQSQQACPRMAEAGSTARSCPHCVGVRSRCSTKGRATRRARAATRLR